MGETSRTIFVRANQHREDCLKVIRMEPQQLVQEQDIRKPDCSSWMVDHHRKEHKEEQPPDPVKDYKFELVSKHKEPMTRQIEEAVRINQTFSKRTITTNSGEV